MRKIDSKDVLDYVQPMNWTCDAAVFDELLELNPWSMDLWKERLRLIRADLWNINHMNQGGNSETRNWLNAFFEARSAASLSALRGPSNEYDKWAREIGLIAQRVFADHEIANAIAGSPMHQVSDDAFMVNVDPTVEGYSAGQFRADILLLTQVSLRRLEIGEPLDMSSKVFPVGLDMVFAKFQAPLNATGASFGPFSDFSSARFQTAEFSRCTFHDQAYFSVSAFDGDAVFAGSVFHGPCEFNATSFSGQAVFNECQFHDSVGFCGSLFETTPDFSNAVFEGSTTFEDSVFHASAWFEGTSFPGRVHVGRVPKDVRQGIIDAHHPS